MLASFAPTGIEPGISHVLERDGTFHIFSCEYGLVFPFHEDLDVGWHGVSAYGQSGHEI
jgi:hypothetical protein